ncbi:MAG: T9SS type A sorting domain-containing protein [Bacteroidales bacterium]
MKKLHTFTLIMLLMMLFASAVGFAQVTLSATGGTLTGTYTTLKDAFGAINSGTHTGAIAITITGTTTETASAVLNASGTGLSSYTDLSIQPSGVAAINGNIFGYLVDLNGADHVTFNGLNAGGNSLTISNTGTTSSSTIRLYNDATGNLITKCSILGSTIVSGVINFGSGVTTGNDNNTISYCNIGPASTDLPICGIYSSGTSLTADNSSNIVTDNNIYDYYNASSSTAGMNINSFNSAWTITNNRFYQTASRVFTSSGTHYGIFINSGSAYSISNNTIGYANSTGTGTTNLIGLTSGSLGGTFPGAYTTGGAANQTRYAAIYCTFLVGGAVSSIQGNTIAGFAIYTSYSSSVTFGIFGGIAVTAGNANIGTVTGNTIGTPASSIYTASTGSGGSICGIYVSSANTVTVQNNLIQNLDAMGTIATATGAMNCINIEGTGGTIIVSGNTIGNANNPNLRMGNLTTGAFLSNAGTTFGQATGSGIFYGIRNTNTGTVTLGASGLPNIIRNAYQNSTNANALFRVILSSAGTVNVSYNTIQNISSGAAGVSYGSGGLAGVGILMATGSQNPVVTNNTISGLSLTNSGTGGYTLAGIVYHNPAGSVTVSKNRISGLSNASTSVSTTAPGTATGIFIANGAGVPTSIDNNMISLGNGQTTNTTFIGIWPQLLASVATTMKIYYNTINIEGSVATGAQPSMCIQRGDFSTTAATTFTIDARNNIFSNTRSGGTGKHYALANSYGASASSATGWGANATNYNVLNGNTATIGYWSGDRTFGDWQTSSACDANSLSAIPVNFTSTASGDLHLSMGYTPTLLESGCLVITGFTTDIDGDPRPGPIPTRFGGGTAPDFGADEFDGVPTGLPAMTLSGIPTNASCPALSDGAISTVAGGGVSPYSYIWSNGAVTSGLTGISAGTYTVTVTDAVTSAITGSWTVTSVSPVCPTISVSGDITSTGCFNATQTIYVAEAPNTLTIQSGGSATLIAGENIFFYPGTQVFEGGYMDAYISTSYCGAKAPMLPAAAGDMEEPAFNMSQTQFAVYPNPTNGNFTLIQKGEKQFSSVKIEMYDMHGERILSSQMIGEKQHEFITSALPSGLYFIKVIAGNDLETIKLVKGR